MKLFMEHSARQHMAAVGSSATQACSFVSCCQTSQAMSTVYITRAHDTAHCLDAAKNAVTHLLGLPYHDACVSMCVLRLKVAANIVIAQPLELQEAPHGLMQTRERVQEHALERLLLPLSGLTSWLIVLAGGLSLLHVLGINVAPLLTVGGVSGILVGLSAQSVMANMIAGINLVSLYCIIAPIQ